MKKNENKTNNAKMKHSEIKLNENHKTLVTNSASVNWANINPNFVAYLRDYRTSENALGIIDKKMAEYRDNYDKIVAEIVGENSMDALSDDDKLKVANAKIELDALLEKCSEDKKPHNKTMSKCVAKTLKIVQVKDYKKGEYITMRDAYALYVVNGGAGFFKSAIIELMKNMGIATDKTNAGDSVVNRLLIETIKAVGMQTVSNKDLADDDNARHYKPWSEGAYNKRFMKRLIDMCVENGVKI